MTTRARRDDFRLKKQWFVTSKTGSIESAYRFDKELGSGAYGKVMKGTNLTSNQQVAIKMIQKNRINDYRTFQTEFEILRVLDHPNIVKVIETYETERLCYLIMEVCDGGELFDRIISEKQLSEAHAASIMRKLFSALSYCHDQGICHRDIKPENCLFVNNDPESDIKLIDFGLAKDYSEASVMQGLHGTPYYIAPDVLSGSYTNAIDCWSLGVLLYIMLSGTPPFNGRTNEEILMHVYDGSYSFRPRAFQTVSNMAKDLISRLLVKDPRLRITAKEAFNHPWVTGLAPLPMAPLDSTVFEDMHTFVQSQNLKKATLMFIASRLTERDIKNLKDVFVSLDTDGDGMLSRPELDLGLSQSRINIQRNTMDTMWEIMDTNRNGLLDYTEFLTACMNTQSYMNSGILRTAFEYFDRDGNGLITYQELRSVFKDKDTIILKEQELESMISEVDANGDGYVDYSEFLQMMTGRNLI